MVEQYDFYGLVTEWAQNVQENQQQYRDESLFKFLAQDYDPEYNMDEARYKDLKLMVISDLLDIPLAMGKGKPWGKKSSDIVQYSKDQVNKLQANLEKIGVKKGVIQEFDQFMKGLKIDEQTTFGKNLAHQRQYKNLTTLAYNVDQLIKNKDPSQWVAESNVVLQDLKGQQNLKKMFFPKPPSQEMKYQDFIQTFTEDLYGMGQEEGFVWEKEDIQQQKDVAEQLHQIQKKKPLSQQEELPEEPEEKGQQITTASRHLRRVSSQKQLSRKIPYVQIDLSEDTRILQNEKEKLQKRISEAEQYIREMAREIKRVQDVSDIEAHKKEAELRIKEEQMKQQKQDFQAQLKAVEKRLADKDIKKDAVLLTFLSHPQARFLYDKMIKEGEIKHEDNIDDKIRKVHQEVQKNIGKIEQIIRKDTMPYIREKNAKTESEFMKKLKKKNKSIYNLYKIPWLRAPILQALKSKKLGKDSTKKEINKFLLDHNEDTRVTFQKFQQDLYKQKREFVKTKKRPSKKAMKKTAIEIIPEEQTLKKIKPSLKKGIVERKRQ